MGGCEHAKKETEKMVLATEEKLHYDKATGQYNDIGFDLLEDDDIDRIIMLMFHGHLLWGRVRKEWLYVC